MAQRTFAELEYDAKKRVTLREKFSGPYGPVDSMAGGGSPDSARLPEGGTGPASLPARDDVCGSTVCSCFYNLSDPGM